ncbi:glucose-methanol-choline oxidoreductase (SMG1) [Botrytis cinerea]
MVVPTDNHFDFIVVGGGTGGNTVAGRLAENPNVKILIIEAGPGHNKDIPEIQTPARAFELRGSQYDWAYKTTMIDREDYTRVEKPNTRGKVLGGSSALNYYTWIRGSKATFDDWEEYGGPSWTWDNCKEYFDKPANYHDDSHLYNPDLAKHGRNGPLDVAVSDMQGGILNDEIYDGEMHGLARCMNTIYKGVRSTSALFLEGKPNITILGHTHAKQILIEDGAATGVVVITAEGDELTIRAKKEIIVSSGVYETPKLLMLSGIGPVDELAPHGIDVKVESQHVGKNLLDHPIMPHVFRLKDGLGLEDHLLRAGPQHDGAISAYRKNKSGPFSSGLLELVGLPRIDEYLATSKEYVAAKKANNDIDPFGPGGQPHFEIDFVPMFSDAFQWHIPTPPTGSWLTVIVDLLRPLSRNGYVKLNSTNPFEQPMINLNFFSNDLDLVALREGYPCGTARLGKSIEQGAVDHELRVFGVKNLRVTDASVFPVIPDCRIQNAVYMVAERGADFIKAAHPDLYQ